MSLSPEVPPRIRRNYDYVHGNYAAMFTVGIPATVLSSIALRDGLYPNERNPLRDETILGLDNFFDHVGNCVNGQVAAMVTIGGLTYLDSKYNGDSESKVRPLAIAAAGAAVAGSVNAAYEAGVTIPPYTPKPEEAPFDAPDAIYGGVTGLLFSGVFAATVLHRRIKRNKN